MTVPWFALSPSPFTISAYLILVIYGTKKLLKRRTYKRLKVLLAFTDSAFILAYLVLMLDTFWIVFCGLRFGWTYPDSVLGLVFAGIRNLIFMGVCWLLIGRYFTDDLILKPKVKTFYLFCLNLVFLGLWFWLSPSPAYTDWTFAIKYGYPLQTILTSFFISHVIGKSIVAGMFLSYW